MRRSRSPHCQRRALPCPLKLEIILRQNGCCANCGTQLTIRSLVFDHRPPLALRDVWDDPNDPERLAALCSRCDGQKTPRDLREIARVKRRGFTYNQHQERHRVRLAREGLGLPHDAYELASDAPRELEVPRERGDPPHNLYEDAVRRAEERWTREESGLGSSPRFSKSDLT